MKGKLNEVSKNSLIKGEILFCSNGTAINRTVVCFFSFKCYGNEKSRFTQLFYSCWLETGLSAIKLVLNYFSVLHPYCNGNKYYLLYFLKRY